jgi:hypothetical protein
LLRERCLLTKTERESEAEMTETETAGVEVLLSRAQRWQLYAHCLTYMYSLMWNPSAPRQDAMIDGIQGVGIRLAGSWKEEQEEVLLALSADEVQALQAMCAALQPLYEQWSTTAASAQALEHLENCRAWLEKAEQHAQSQASQGTESR